MKTYCLQKLESAVTACVFRNKINIEQEINMYRNQDSSEDFLGRQ